MLGQGIDARSVFPEVQRGTDAARFQVFEVDVAQWIGVEFSGHGPLRMWSPQAEQTLNWFARFACSHLGGIEIEASLGFE